LVCGAAVIQARRITAQGTRITMADTIAAPTPRLMAVISAVALMAVEVEMAAAVTEEEDIDDDPSA
jgi:hypothetical protein